MNSGVLKGSLGVKLYGEMLIPGWVALSVTVLVVVYALWEGNESKLSCGLFKIQGKTLHETTSRSPTALTVILELFQLVNLPIFF